MPDQTDNHEYETPAKGAEDWHEPLNQNFEELDVDVEIRDVAANRASYEPKDGSKFLELDTGIVYVGDGEEWSKELAMASYDESGEIDCGELADCVDDADDDESGSGSGSETFGVNARSVHEGAIVFGDATQRSIWSKYANEIRSQMPIHAPTFATGNVRIDADSVSAGGPVTANSVSASSVDAGGSVTANSVSASSVDAGSLEAAGLSVDSEEFSVEVDADHPQLTIESDEVTVSIDSEAPQLTIEADAIESTVPIHAPSFETGSASASKTDVEPVNPTRALEGVRSLEINTWQFKDGDGSRHLGPMAEDFAETFEVGNGEESIATVDADGVALAAIQGLAAENDELRSRLAALEERLDATTAAQPQRDD